MIISLKIALILLSISVLLFLYFKKVKKYPFQIVLHLGLFVVLYFIIFPPKKSELETNKVIALADNSKTKTAILSKKDSLHIAEVLSPVEFKQNFYSGKIKPQKILLAGTNFDTELIALLTTFDLTYITPVEQNQIQHLSYAAILQQNQTQNIKFNVDSESKQYAKIRLGDTCLDSVLLEKGQNSAELSFPVFGIGRNQMQLEIGNAKTPIHFFSLKSTPLHIQIMSQVPDFEIKTLAEWLSKQGHKVSLQSDLSIKMGNQIAYNKVNNKADIDLIICTPDNINSSLKYKSRAIFVLGLTDIPRDIQTINKRLNTNFQIEKQINASTRTVANGAEAAGYTFKPNWQQTHTQDLEIIRQGTGAATTLLQTTYPLILSGDSIAYAKIWVNLLQLFSEKPNSFAHLTAPMQTHKAYQIHPETSSGESLKQVTSFSNEPFTVFTKTGWQNLNDSSEVFIDSTQAFHTQLDAFKNYIQPTASTLKSTEIAPKQEASRLVFYILFVLIYGGIWFINRN